MHISMHIYRQVIEHTLHLPRVYHRCSTQLTRMQVALGVIEALCYCHSLKPEPVLHLDLKTENILLSAGPRPGRTFK